MAVVPASPADLRDSVFEVYKKTCWGGKDPEFRILAGCDNLKNYQKFFVYRDAMVNYLEPVFKKYVSGGLGGNMFVRTMSVFPEDALFYHSLSKLINDLNSSGAFSLKQQMSIEHEGTFLVFLRYKTRNTEVDFTDLEKQIDDSEMTDKMSEFLKRTRNLDYIPHDQFNLSYHDAMNILIAMSSLAIPCRKP